MYRNAYQRGILTVFFSVGSKPLEIWETHTKDGYISRFLDQDIKSMVLEIRGNNVSTTYMICPKGNTVLGITMPFLVMIVKNLKKYFSFEVTILDETSTRRRFRVSNFQSNTQIQPLCTVMPIGLSDGWNQIQFNLAEFTRRAYKKQFVEVQKIKINANIRLRRIYFTEKLIPEDQLPPEYKLYFPLPTKIQKTKKTSTEDENKENLKPQTSQQNTKTSSKINNITPSSKVILPSKKLSSQTGKTSENVMAAERQAAPTPTDEEDVNKETVNDLASESQKAVPHAEVTGEGHAEVTEEGQAEVTGDGHAEEKHDTDATPSEPGPTE